MTDLPASSCVIEERHETEIHVQLLMTMKECPPRVVRDKIKLRFLKSAQHHHILDHARGRLASDTRQLEAVAVQVQRVNIIARVAELLPVAVSHDFMFAR